MDETKQEINLREICSYKIEDSGQKQFYQIVLLSNKTIVGFFSRNEEYFLVWFIEEQTFETKLDFLEYDAFETPAFFHFENSVGIYSYKNNFITIYNEDKVIKLPIINSLPKLKYPDFEKTICNYHRAGKTDNNIIPFLFLNMGLIPVYIADLRIDIENSKAEWITLKYWNNQTEINLEKDNFEKPQKIWAILDTLNKNNISYTFGIGNRDGGYLKYGMDFSDLITINEIGKKENILFSLGNLHKDSKKGGKECIFSSSGKYAILTPVYKSDSWDNKQKLFDLSNKELIDVKLPRGFSKYRIIDHNNNCFLLVDNYINQLFTRTENITISNAK